MEIQKTGERYSKMQEISGSDVSMLSVKKSENDFTTAVDDFNKSADELMKLSGLSHNFRRAAKRKIEKADNNSLTGDGSSSKQMIPDKYGYGIFDVVEAPYNLLSLSLKFIFHICIITR